MKCRNVDSNFYINNPPIYKGKQITIISKPLEEPVKKSGRNLGGMILSGLASLGMVFDKKPNKTKTRPIHRKTAK